MLLIRDMQFLIGFIGIASVWVIFLVMANVDVDDPATAENESWTAEELETFGIIFVVISVAELGLPLWRYRLWSGMINDGVEHPARVTNIKMVGDGESIFVSYTHDGTEIANGRPIGGLIRTSSKRLSLGDEVTVIVSSKKPDRYVLLDLHLKPQA